MEQFKQLIQPYALEFTLRFQSIIVEAEKLFIEKTESINFPLFCSIYTVILLFILSKIGQKIRYRPKNRELVSTKQYYKEKITTWIMNLPIVQNVVRKKIKKDLDKVDQSMVKMFEGHRDPRKAWKLPSIGMSEQNLKKRINEWYAKQTENISTGKVSGTLYTPDQQFNQNMSNFAAKYMYQNPLHLDSFKELVRIQSQVLKMTASLISSEPEKNAFGICTSGGSQSLMMALMAYRVFYKDRKKPNIVVPNTIHAAVDKGCFYFNIEARKARLNKNFQVDVKHLESLIDSNTILIMGSYPNYPHGIIDPIAQLARLGIKYNVGVHIDGCLGGFVVAFDKQHKETFNIDRKGITSISIDHHKFGLAPKGISGVFFKTKELRHCMYYIDTEWIGGIYCTPSFAGSRSGFASAGAWYALTHVTKKGYKRNAQEIIEATKQAASKLRKIEGVTVIGNPEVCALAFTTGQVSCHIVNSYLTKQKHYDISSIHKPDGIHVSVTLANCDSIRNQLANDVAEAIAYVKKNNPKSSGVAAIYGATAQLPNAEVGVDLVRTIISAALK